MTKPPKPSSAPRPMPPRPHAGGSYRFDEVAWAYVPVTPPPPQAGAETPADPPVNPSEKELPQ